MATKLRLFKIQPTKKAEPVYFQHKQQARAHRDQLLADGISTVVMRGPDHWRGESFNVSKNTPGARQREW